MEFLNIIDRLPYAKPFLFVDELLHVDDKGAKGTFIFQGELDFYEGHFKESPVTPGVILTECCAQIGLVCLGIFLMDGQGTPISGLQFGLSSVEMDYLQPVFPNEKVIVSSEKVYFRFNKLKCKVKMHNVQGDLICKGVLSAMIKSNDNG